MSHSSGRLECFWAALLALDVWRPGGLVAAHCCVAPQSLMRCAIMPGGVAKLPRWRLKPRLRVSRGARAALGRSGCREVLTPKCAGAVSYTHLRAHETGRNIVCRL